MKISQTAMRNAVLRAVESSRHPKERLFTDPYAPLFLNINFQIVLKLLLMPRIGRAVLKRREKKYPGMIGNFLCRTRYIDDLAKNLLKETFDQIIFLGAGFDTRPFRIPGMQNSHIYEVDHPFTQKQKKKKLERITGKISDHMSFIPVDFNHDEIEDNLRQTDFDPAARSLFIWEAVSQYIKEESAYSLFSFLSHAASPDSRVIFTYIDKDYIDEGQNTKRSDALAVHHAKLKEPWIFGIDKEELSSFIGSFGFEVIEQASAPDYRERYLDPIGRKMNVFEGEIVVLARAVKKNHKK
jgi:methyltransferase (TIGR00027 family)